MRHEKYYNIPNMLYTSYNPMTVLARSLFFCPTLLLEEKSADLSCVEHGRTHARVHIARRSYAPVI